MPSTPDSTSCAACESQPCWGPPATTRATSWDAATVAALSSWPTSDLFTDTDRACLAFAEQFVIDVASLSDDQAAAVSDRLGPQGFADFVHGLLVTEQRQRLQLVWGRLFQETSP